MTTEPRACPLCGREPTICDDDSYGGCYISCASCDITPDQAIKKVGELDQAIAAWNTRPPSERETALEAELAEVRARVKVLSSLGSGPHPQLRALDEALARATAAEASAREAWKVLDVEDMRLLIWSHTGCESKLALEAAEAINEAIRAKAQKGSADA